MRISEVPGSLKTAAIRKKEAKEKETNFLGSTEAKPDSSSITGAEAPQEINPLFMLQETDIDETKNSSAIDYGFDVLEYLEGFRIGLLNGSLPITKIKELQHSIDRWRRIYDDPKLKNIIDDIELRAKIELAKLNKYL